VARGGRNAPIALFELRPVAVLTASARRRAKIQAARQNLQLLRRRGWIARSLLLSSRIIASVAGDDSQICVNLEQVALDESAQKASASAIANHRPVRHTNGWMARMSQAPSFILAAPDAPTRPVAMEVRAAAAQSKRWRNRR
jgi:hypothetical protein